MSWFWLRKCDSLNWLISADTQAASKFSSWFSVCSFCRCCCALHVVLWLQQKGYDSCSQRLSNGVKLNTAWPKPRALFQAWGQKDTQREKLPCLLNSVLCEICPHVIWLVLSGSWVLSCSLPPGMFLQHMWLRSSVPWECGRGGDRQPKAGNQQVLFELWPAGRRALDWLLQVPSGFVRTFGTQHPPSFPPVEQEPGFCTGQCLAQNYGVCTMNYLR